MSINPVNSSSNEYLLSPTFLALPADIQEYFIQSFTSEELNARFLPELFPPSSDASSILGFFATLQDSAQGLRQQLFVARQEDLNNPIRSEALAAATSAISQAYTDSKNTGKTVGDQVKTTIQDGITTASQQNSRATNLNNGAATEASNAAQQVQGYNTFKNSLIAMGATYVGLDSNGDEIYSLPSGSNPSARTAAYNAAASTYVSQTSSFNLYWQNRSQDISNYNVQTSTYNTGATSNTNYLQGILTQYELTEDIDNAGYLDHFTQPTANLRTENNLFAQTRATTPNNLNNPTYPVLITMGKPSDWVSTKASSTASSLSVSTISYPALSSNSLDEIASIVGGKVGNTIIIQNTTLDLVRAAYMRNLTAAGVFDLTEEDPIEGSILLPRKRIYPTTSVDSFQPADTSMSRGGADAVTALTLTKSDHLMSLMGQAIINLVIRNLKLDKELDTTIKDQLVILAFNFIQSNAAPALLNSISPLANILPSLSPSDPLVTLLFSLSLANVLQQAIQQGNLREALKAFVAANPELGNLTEEQLSQLEAALTTGVLTVATQLITTNLGTPEVLAPVLSDAVLPSDTSQDEISEIIHQAVVDAVNELGDLRIELENNFRAQGFAKEDAAFLAEQDAIAQSYALYPSPQVVTAQSVNQEILKNSIASGLLKSGIAQDRAVNIAQEAIQKTILADAELSLESFGRELERNLRRADVERQNVRSVVEQAVIVPPQPPELTSAAGISSLLGSPLLATLTTSAVYKILGPNRDGALSALVTAELNNALYGTPNPTSGDKEGVKAPNSLVNQIKDQLAQLRIDDHEKYTEAVTDLFKETIKPSVELNVFLQKLMDPAYYFLYVISQSSLMTARNDIPTVQV